MIDKQFDDILKNKLSDMTDTSRSDWSAFEQKLDDAQVSDSTSEGDFDQIIQQKLAGMTAASPSSDWATFEHMLDDAQLTDEVLDDKVSREMNSMRAPYRHDHWELLHDNLELQKTRNQNIIGYKIIELSLLFLVLLSANNLYKYLPSTFEMDKPAVQVDNTMIYASLDDQTETTSDIILDDKKSIGYITDNNNSIGATTRTVKSNRTTVVVEKLATNTQINLTAIAANDIATPSSTELIENSSSTAVAKSSTTYSGIVNGSALENISNQTYTPIAVIKPINNLLSHDRKVIDRAARYTPHILYPRSKSKESITVYAGIDNNLVNSPFDDVYDTEGFRTYGIGYSAGIEYGKQVGNKEWSIGIGYSNRSYEPRIIDELTGDVIVNLYDTSLEHIEFDILSLSAGLKFKLKETDNWSFDLGIGASANIVIHTDYLIETVNIRRNGRIVNSRVNTPSGLDLNSKPLHDGIYEGGSLQENIYLTTDISFGLERKFSDKISFTLRPEYSVHSFSNGIGPNNDLINNLSLNLGVKYLL